MELCHAAIADTFFKCFVVLSYWFERKTFVSKYKLADREAEPYRNTKKDKLKHH